MTKPTETNHSGSTHFTFDSEIAYVDTNPFIEFLESIVKDNWVYDFPVTVEVNEKILVFHTKESISYFVMGLDFQHQTADSHFEGRPHPNQIISDLNSDL